MFNLAILAQGSDNAELVNVSIYDRNYNQSAITNNTVTMPADIEDGDLLIFSVQTYGRGSDIVNPAGLTVLESNTPNSISGRAWYSKIAASEPPTMTFSTTIDDWMAVTITAYRGVNTVSVGTVDYSSPASVLTAPSMTAPKEGVLMCFFPAYAAGDQTILADTVGMTKYIPKLIGIMQLPSITI